VETSLVELFKHNLWANLRLLDACAELTPEQLEATIEGTYGRIQDTFVHLLAAEGRYVELLTGVKRGRPLSERNPFPGLDELRHSAQASGEALIEIAANDPYTDTLKANFQGEEHNLRAVVPLLQAIHHAHDHRTHISTILSQIGVEPPDLSLWTYGDQMGY